MEKTTLTTEHNAYCDTYDTKFNVKMHIAQRKRKALVSLKSKKGKGEKVSLWKEDVESLAKYLTDMAKHLDSKLDIPPAELKAAQKEQKAKQAPKKKRNR